MKHGKDTNKLKIEKTKCAHWINSSYIYISFLKLKSKQPFAYFTENCLKAAEYFPFILIVGLCRRKQENKNSARGNVRVGA